MPEVTALCQALVRMPGVSGQEGAVAALVAETMSGLGYDEVQVDAYGSVIGRRIGSRPGPTVLFDAHLDTVSPAGSERWQRDPFGGEIADGQLWGLGAADVKGSLAAMLTGLAGVPRDRLAGQVILSASVSEENVTGAALAHVLARHPADLVVIGEPTELRLGIAQKGRADLIVHAAGRSAHTSQPELGDNAVYKMLDAVTRLRNLTLPGDPALGSGVLELVEIISEPFPGSTHVPHGCRSRFVARTMPGESAAGVLERLRAAVAVQTGVTVDLEETRQPCYTGATLVHGGFLPGWRAATDAPWLVRLRTVLQAIGVHASTFAAPFGCNASISAGLHGIPTVIFGPGSLATAHAPDEHIALEQLLAGERAYAAIARGGVVG